MEIAITLQLPFLDTIAHYRGPIFATLERSAQSLSAKTLPASRVGEGTADTGNREGYKRGAGGDPNEDVGAAHCLISMGVG